MDQLPCKGCRGLCCGPVPITEEELKKIKRSVKAMPEKKRTALRSQQRFFGTCIFYDQDNDRCGIHFARPEVCEKFGYYQGLTCFRKPELAVKPLNREFQHRRVAGTLSIDFTWKDFDMDA